MREHITKMVNFRIESLPFSNITTLRLNRYDYVAPLLYVDYLACLYKYARLTDDAGGSL